MAKETAFYVLINNMEIGDENPVMNNKIYADFAPG